MNQTSEKGPGGFPTGAPWEVAPAGRRKAVAVFLGVVLGFSLILACIILRFFWRPMIFAAIIGIGFYPVHARIKKLIPRESASALISTLIVLLVLVLSAVFLASVASNEIVRAAQWLGSRAGRGGDNFGNAFHAADHLSSWLEKYVDVEETGLRSTIDSLPAKISQALFAIAAALVTGLATFLGQGVITFFILFFVFRDGAATTVRATSLLPIERGQVDRLVSRIRDNIFANLYGILAVALAQGLLAGAAFAVLGVPSPILFGIAAAVCSLVPLVGPSLIWLPVSIFLFATGHWMKALILIGWGAIVVGTADNIVRPLVIMGRVRLHPLILLFALVGGVQQFGFVGLFIGPVLMSVIAALVDMLQQEISEARQEPSTRAL